MEEAQGLHYLKEFLNQPKRTKKVCISVCPIRGVLLTKKIDHPVPCLALFVEAHTPFLHIHFLLDFAMDTLPCEKSEIAQKCGYVSKLKTPQTGSSTVITAKNCAKALKFDHPRYPRNMGASLDCFQHSELMRCQSWWFLAFARHLRIDSHGPFG